MRLWYLNLCLLGNISRFIFQNQLFLKILSGIPSESQTSWIQIRPDILSGLIWVQTVSKGYQQTTLGGKELMHRLSRKCSDEPAHLCYLVRDFTVCTLIKGDSNIESRFI